jgi:serine-threonine kinase receptor-associated protein
MWCHLLDSATGEELEACRGHHGPIHALRFAPGGATYASGSEDGTIRLWSTDWVERHGAGAGAEAAAEAAAAAAVAEAAAASEAIAAA